MNKDVQLSKLLSWLLRHGAVKEGLQLSPEGYIEVDKILQQKSFLGKYSESDIERVVSNNDKQRFRLRRNENTQSLEIKATQGHTIADVLDTELKPLLKCVYKTIVHGTYMRHWTQIKRHGLSRMKRRHIHLAKGTLRDKSVVSGLRHDVQIYIFVNLKKALEENIKFFESENGVILTAGNRNGYLEPKYFEKVIVVGSGEQLYP